MAASLPLHRFVSVLNFKIHFHMLFLDRVWIGRCDGSLRYRWTNAHTSAEVTRLTPSLALRIAQLLARLLAWTGCEGLLHSGGCNRLRDRGASPGRVASPHKP
jgi:hypothetical protein